MTEPARPATTYYLRPFWRLYAVGIFFVALGLASAFVWLGAQVFPGQPASQALMFAFAALLAALGAFLSLAALRIRLVVSAEGLTLFALGYQVHAGWDQLSDLGAQPGCSGLFVANPTVTISGWFAFLLRFRQPLFWLGLLSGRYRPVPALGRYAQCIPVQVFASNWEDSALAREIAVYRRPDQARLA